MPSIQLYMGDCLEIMNKLIEQGVEVDYTFTSPPYNRKRNDKYTNYNDSITNYFEFLCDFTNKAIQMTSKHLFINLQSNYYNKKDVNKFIGAYADKIQQTIIWEKTNPMPACGYNITNAYEYIFVLGSEALKSNFTYTKNHITTTVNYNRDNKIHKAVMNQNVSDWFVKTFTKENDTILDPFMGLGTTGKSCKAFNRNFIGIELDEQYFNIAKERIEKSS